MSDHEETMERIHNLFLSIRYKRYVSHCKENRKTKIALMIMLTLCLILVITFFVASAVETFQEL